MNTPPRRIAETGLFKPVWREFNRLVEYVREISPVGGRNIRQTRTMNGTLTVAEESQRQEDAGSTVQRFKVITDEDDYLVCQKEAADGTLDATSINVAKPRMLRLTTFNGVTIGSWSYTGTKTQRTAKYAGTNVAGGIQNGDSWIETLDPVYAAATEIFASEADGETGVTVASVRATWIDLNVDARRWVAQRDRVEACKTVNGVQSVRKIVIEGGPSFA